MAQRSGHSVAREAPAREGPVRRGERAGRRAADAHLVARARRGDREARGRLVEQYMGLIRSLAWRYRDMGLPVEDLGAGGRDRSPGGDRPLRPHPGRRLLDLRVLAGTAVDHACSDRPRAAAAPPEGGSRAAPVDSEGDCRARPGRPRPVAERIGRGDGHVSIGRRRGAEGTDDRPLARPELRGRKSARGGTRR